MNRITENIFTCKRDNLTIHGTEYRPEGDTLPAAIVCHGIFSNQDRVRHYAKELAEEGYVSYCFDFCGGSAPGTGKSEGDSRDMSVLTEIKDLESVIEYVQSRPYVQGKMLLMGCSLGGFVSGMTAAKHPELFEKVILLYPALCVPDDARAGDMRGAQFDPKQIPEEFQCGPMILGRGYPEAVMELDAFEAIKGYTGPVLLMHGTADEIVSVDYSKKAHQILENSELVIIEGGKHVFEPEHDVQVIEVIKNFIKK